MDILLPRTLDEALGLKSKHPEAIAFAGGTDLMVELNLGRRLPRMALDIYRLPELRQWYIQDGTLFLGAGMTYSRIIRELPEFTALAQASRSVGSPQIRNRGTIGGNLGTASPAGDALPVLAACDAEVVLARDGDRTRTLPWHRFLVGPKKTAIEPDELILGARWHVTRGPGSFSKVGRRNAMVIAIASLCLVLDEDRHAVRVALGSVGPTVLRAPEAEAFAADALAGAGAWGDPAAHVPPQVLEAFGERVAAAARPIDDIRGTAAYRRHACAVLARRALRWALEDRLPGPGGGGPASRGARC
ncbi:MAG: xanthine dehydrogenase family protein subunit M [Armatimonadetes bacterium]|nr:xanthine dehydrogenase family protein subunit M [Armatimonadota bacterium]